jgi:Sulfotransferase domain
MSRTPWQRLRVRVGRATLRYRAAWPPTLYPPEPPALEAGAVTGPPDYVGIGAPRSGSTWWARQLMRHEAIPRTQLTKELHWFDWFGTREHTAADVAAYHRFFPRFEGEVVGEWTPGYLYQPWTPALLRTAAPDAKLLAILRDPVDQIESSVNYSHTFHGAPDNPLMLTRHVAEAGYVHHLDHWTQQFPAPLLVLQFERCRDDTATELTRTLEFLGLDPARIHPRRHLGTNAGGTKPIRFTPGARGALVERLTEDVLALAKEHPAIDLARWPNFAHLA